MEQLKIDLTQQYYECVVWGWVNMNCLITVKDLYHSTWDICFEKNTPIYVKFYCNTQIIVKVFQQWARLKFNKWKSKLF